MSPQKSKEGNFRRGFTKLHLRGKHFFTLTEELNEAFLRECENQRRGPADMIRIILEDRYAPVRIPRSVDIKPRYIEPIEQKKANT